MLHFLLIFILVRCRDPIYLFIYLIFIELDLQLTLHSTGNSDTSYKKKELTRFNENFENCNYYLGLGA